MATRKKQQKMNVTTTERKNVINVPSEVAAPVVESKEKTESKQTKKAIPRLFNISDETKKKATALMDRVNDKSFGKKVKLDALLSIALDLVDNSHIKRLQDGSLSNKDRKERALKIYREKVKPVTEDEFTGFMMTSDFIDFMNQYKELIETV